MLPSHWCLSQCNTSAKVDSDSILVFLCVGSWVWSWKLAKLCLSSSMQCNRRTLCNIIMTSLLVVFELRIFRQISTAIVVLWNQCLWYWTVYVIVIKSPILLCWASIWDISQKRLPIISLFDVHVDRLRIIPFIHKSAFVASEHYTYWELCIATYIEHPWCGAVKSPMALFLCFTQEGAHPLPYIISNHMSICKPLRMHIIKRLNLYYYSEGCHFFISSFSFTPHNYNDVYLQKWWCYWADKHC